MNTKPRLRKKKGENYPRSSISCASITSPISTKSTNTTFGTLPCSLRHKSACAPILPFPRAAFVLAACTRSGTLIPRMSTLSMWLTMYIRPSGEAPGGRSMLQFGKDGSVSPNGVSKK